MIALAENSGRERGLGKPFPKGVSGNPGGVPRWVKKVRKAAGLRSVRAVQILAELMESDEDSKVRIAAAVAILKYAGCEPNGNVIVVPQAPTATPAASLPTDRLLQLKKGSGDDR